MKNNRTLWRWLLPAAIILAAAGLFLGGMLSSTAPETAVAQEDTTPADTNRTISVTGAGQVSATPDTAVVRLGVQTDADTAADALEQNSLRMQDVISATLDAGVAEEDIRTSGLRLQPRYDRADEEAPDTIIGYRANNSVEITVTDLDGLGELLDTAVAAGSNTIDSIQFQVSNRNELMDAAREAAMNDAIAKAEQLTELAGASLGPVLTINETSRPAPAFAQEAAFDGVGGAAVPVQPGSQTIEVTVNVTWFIE